MIIDVRKDERKANHVQGIKEFAGSPNVRIQLTDKDLELINNMSDKERSLLYRRLAQEHYVPGYGKNYNRIIEQLKK